MRVLLDESLPHRLSHELLGHEVVTVAQSGWSGIKNGKLLALASVHFDVFITADQNLQYQQNLAALPIPIIVLVAVNNRLESLLPLVPQLLSALEKVQAKTVIQIR